MFLLSPAMHLWEFYRSHCGIYYRLRISIGTLSHSLS